MDALVKSAIAHWAPRFVANGVALTDFEEVTAGIASWNDWCGAWSDKAAVHDYGMQTRNMNRVTVRGTKPV